MIEGDSYLTYILSLLWGPIFLCYGGANGTYTTQSKILRSEIFGSWPNANCNREYSWHALDLMGINIAAYKIAWPYTEIERFILIINDLEIS